MFLTQRARSPLLWGQARTQKDVGEDGRWEINGRRGMRKEGRRLRVASYEFRVEGYTLHGRWTFASLHPDGYDPLLRRGN